MQILFVLFVVLLFGCSEETRLTQPPPVDAPATVFPITVASGERHLVDGDGQPFMIHGDSGWSVISEATREDAEAYISDRRARGFNAFTVVLIDHTPTLVNAYGEPPFLVDGDFGTPNEAYFRHADWVIEQANAAGFLVWVSPIYYGWMGNETGFYSDVIAAGPEAMRAWGRWVGERYRDVEGLVWLMGGDYVPPPEGVALLGEVVQGIRESGDEHHFAAHWARETSGWEVDVDWLDLNTTYSSPPMYLKSLADRDGMNAPLVLLEAIYENEYEITLPEVRAQAWQAMLCGSTGHFFGSWPVWKFADGWRGGLNSDGSISMTHLRNLFVDLPWWTLEPDTGDGFLTAGRGEYGQPNYVTLARNDSLAVAYLPDARELAFDVSAIGGTLGARWFDPTDGRFTEAGTLVQGTPIAPPGPNAAGDDDWVLVIGSMD